MPNVSVIIPNYNHARYLRQRIESVLRQTYQDFEVILLDGTRRMFDMDDEDERRVLAAHFGGGEVACAQTREFDFHQAFLKLTGTEFT